MPVPITLELPPLVQPRQVAALFGICGKTLAAWIRDGEFPAPIRVGKSRRFWPREVILNYLTVRQQGGAGHG
jgi:predicted DNA-binding transcriptional regulator AlpA